jgi:phosphopantetheinyl transferase (holo-ACP synthase)
VAKALQIGVRWREIEIIGAGGAPRVALSGRTLAAAAGRRVMVSLSHSGDIAVAVAVAYGGEQ